MLEHPNVVATHEVGEADGLCFSAMEYLCGEDWAYVLRVCRRQGVRAPVDVCIPVAVACADGLAFAHGLPDFTGYSSALVHGSVNPSNIFVTYSGTAKLLNFSASRIRDGSWHTNTEGSLGDLRYIAPEHVSGHAAEGRADLFALGVVLWEGLTGTRFFRASADELALGVVGQEIPAPSSLRNEIPGRLDDIVLKSLESSPHGRFGVVAQFAEALVEVVPDARSPAAAQRVSEWMAAVFSRRRVELKRQIASGLEVEAALREIGSIEEQARMTSVPSQPVLPIAVGSRRITRPTVPVSARRWTSVPGAGASAVANFATLDGTQEPFVVPGGRGRARWTESWGLKAGLVAPLVALAVSGIVVALSIEPRGSIGAGRRAKLEVQSEPSGASIFLNGEPIGMETPAEIRSVAARTKIVVRVAKSGFRSAEREVEVEPGAVRLERFSLARNTGFVELRGLRKGAKAYVDGRRVETRRGPLRLLVGAHDVHVELRETLLFEGTIDVRPGRQVADLSVELARE